MQCGSHSAKITLTREEQRHISTRHRGTLCQREAILTHHTRHISTLARQPAIAILRNAQTTQKGDILITQLHTTERSTTRGEIISSATKLHRGETICRKLVVEIRVTMQGTVEEQSVGRNGVLLLRLTLELV